MKFELPFGVFLLGVIIIGAVIFLMGIYMGRYLHGAFHDHGHIAHHQAARSISTKS